MKKITTLLAISLFLLYACDTETLEDTTLLGQEQITNPLPDRIENQGQGSTTVPSEPTKPSNVGQPPAVNTQNMSNMSNESICLDVEILYLKRRTLRSSCMKSPYSTTIDPTDIELPIVFNLTNETVSIEWAIYEKGTGKKNKKIAESKTSIEAKGQFTIPVNMKKPTEKKLLIWVRKTNIPTKKQ